MERQLIMGAIVASLKTRPVEDANADKKFRKTERNQRNRPSLYFRPSIILGFDGPNVTIFKNIYMNVDKIKWLHAAEMSDGKLGLSWYAELE